MSNSIEDRGHMTRALRLARRGLYTTDPNPRVGCVIVSDGEVVGEGWHQRAGEAHAEIHALSAAGDKAKGATVYITLEPCSHHGRTPPCAEALVAAGVAHVIVAMVDPNPEVAGKGIAYLQAAGIQVDSGLMELDAQALNPGFISRMRRGRPFVRVKLATSLDGRTAMASGESKWITGEAARADVQRLRARASAILTGVGTVLADDPSLTVRDTDLYAGELRQPLRVIIDSNLSTPPDARLLTLPGDTLIVTASDDGDTAEALIKAGAEVLCSDAGAGHIDLAALMGHLASIGINEVLVEAGSTTCGALMEAGLVDELVVYMAPHIMGAGARGMFQLPALDVMADRITLDIVDVRAVGKDWRFTAMPIASSDS